MPDVREVVVAVVRHRVLGHVLTAYLARRVSDTLWGLDGHATPITIGDADALSPDVVALVEMLDTMSEQRLAKSFSRGKTPKAFFEALTDNVLREQVRPFLDKRVCAALPLIVRSGVKVFKKTDQYPTLSIHDRLDVAPPFKSRPKFFFTLAETGDLLYTLKVSDGGSDVSLFGKEMLEVSSSPAVFVSGRVLYSFADVPFAKFRPFASNQRIRVDRKIVDSYMSRFVMGCVKSYWVAAYGFTVNRRNERLRKELRARQTIYGWAFELAFDYAGSECAPSSVECPTTLRRDTGGGYVFDVVRRNFEEERRVRDFLVSDLGLSPLGEVFKVADGKSTLADLAHWANAQCDALMERDIRVVMSDGDERFFFGNWGLRSDVGGGIDWFDVRIVVEIGEFCVPFPQFFRNIAAGDNRFPLPNGEVFIIPDEWFEQWSGAIPFLSVADDGRMRVDKRYSSFLPGYVLPRQADGELPEACGEELRVPRLANVEFRPYQEVGVRWMVSLARHGRGGILADDMGLGKTLQAVALLAALYGVDEAGGGTPFRRNDTGRAPSLVVVPVSLVSNWRREVMRFAPALSVYEYVGRQAVTGVALPSVLGQYHVVITSYGYARLYPEALGRVNFECIILDESHTVKNPASKTYRAVASLRAGVRFNLSGTPIENSLTDLWAQMNIVNPGLLGARDFFDHCYRRPVETEADERRLKLLRAVTKPYILRRTKEQVLADLPPISIQTIECQMTEEQSEIYEREKSACRNLLLDPAAETAGKRFLVLQSLTRLRLLANHPAMSIDGYAGGSGKADMVVEYVSSITRSGHKLLVFSSFVRDMEFLAQRLDDAGIGYAMLTGKTRDRDSLVRSFEASDATKVMFISLKAGGVGLNIVSADYVIILNPWWNPAAEQQAYGRAHRIGQTRSVTVYRFISSGTIEEKIDKMQTRKLKLAQDAVGVSELNADGGAFSEQELEALLLEQ